MQITSGPHPKKLTRLLAITLTAALVGGGGFVAAPALAAPEPVTLTYTGDPEVTAADSLVLTGTVEAEKSGALEIAVQEVDGDVIADTTKDVLADPTQAVEVEIPADLEPGEYQLVSLAPAAESEPFTVAAEPEAPADGEPKNDDQDEAEAAPDGDLPYTDLAASMFDANGDGVYQIPTPQGGATTGEVPAGLEAYYGQTVELTEENCSLIGAPEASWTELPEGAGYGCGYAVAPVDSEDTSAGNMAIGLMKIDSLSDDPKGTIFFNPGGPGGPGLTLGAAVAQRLDHLLEDFHLVGFDPRGVGTSVPVARCSSAEQRDADRASNPHGKDIDAAEEELNDQIERGADDCFANTGVGIDFDGDGSVDGEDQAAQQERAVSHLGTWDAVGDLDLLRSVMGDEGLNFVGMSYGTRLGYVYSQKFPDSVGRLILDGAVDPGQVDSKALAAMQSINSRGSSAEQAAADPNEEMESSLNQIRGFQNTFNQFALQCSAKGAQGITWGEAYPDAFADPTTGAALEPFSCPLGNGITDAEQLTANNAEIMQSLEQNPLPTGNPNDQRTVTFADARTGAIQAMYGESMWGILAFALEEIQEGQSARYMMLLADSYHQRNPDGTYGTLLEGFDTIRCTDENSYGNKPAQADLRAFAEAYDEAAPFQAASISPGQYSACDFWRFKGTLPAAEELDSVPNILVVSTTHDSATPYASGVKLARVINGSLLSVAGNDHTAFLGGQECVEQTTADFLTEGTVPEDGDFGGVLDSPATAVDDRGETVTLPERCQMKTFRTSDFTTSADQAHAGEGLMYELRHQDSKAEYSVAIEDDEAARTSTDNGGNAAGEFTVFDSLEPGDYTVSLRDENGEVVAVRALEVLGDDDPKTDDDGSEDGGADGGSGGGSGDGADHGQAGGSGSGSGGDASGAKDLPRTGASILAQLLISLALLGAGLALHRAASQGRARRELI